MTKTTVTRLLFSALALGFSATAAYAQKLPGEVRARIGMKDGKSPFGFIQNSRPDAIQFSSAEGGAGQRVVLFSALKGEGLDLAIQIEGSAEALAPGRSAFAKGRFQEAADEFGKVAAGYKNLVYIPNNFATEAAWYQIESLRRAGKFGEMAAVFGTNAAKTIPTTLGETYQKQFGYNQIWAIYGAGDMAALKPALEPFIAPSTGTAELLPTKNYRDDIPENELGQIAFLRGKVAEADGEKAKAIQEYYRVFTLNFGSDRVLSKQAMLAALAIHKELGGLEDEKNKLPLQQIQGLAFQYKNTYGIAELPSEFALYAVRPVLPHLQLMAAPKKEETAPAPAPATDGKAADGKAAAPKAKGDDAKAKGEEPKAKGKAKAKPKAK